MQSDVSNVEFLVYRPCPSLGLYAGIQLLYSIAQILKQSATVTVLKLQVYSCCDMYRQTSSSGVYLRGKLVLDNQSKCYIQFGKHGDGDVLKSDRMSACQ